MRLRRRLLLWGGGVLAGLGVAVGQAHAVEPATTPIAVIDLAATTDLDAIVPRLAGERVIYLGESHDQYGHHLLQLEVIRRLHALDPRLAIGFEMFQQPFQAVLDRFIAGDIDQGQMLRESEWYRRWRFDYRLYRPLLEFARGQRIPLVALNLPVELTDRVSEVGVAGLSDEERQGVPEIDESDQAYIGRLRGIFHQHPHQGEQSFDRFKEVQLLWDEGMAARIAEWLQANPEGRLVVIAGGGHLAYRSGIPQRVERRSGAHGAVLMPAGGLEITPHLADFLLFPAEAALPPSGRIGVLLGADGEGVLIEQVMPGSGGEAAGLREGDRIIAIDGAVVSHAEEIFISLLDRLPGEPVRLRYRRDGFPLFGGGEHEVEVVLGK